MSEARETLRRSETVPSTNLTYEATSISLGSESDIGWVRTPTIGRLFGAADASVSASAKPSAKRSESRGMRTVRNRVGTRILSNVARRAWLVSVCGGAWRRSGQS